MAGTATAPDAAELGQIEARLALLPIDQRLAVARRLLGGEWLAQASTDPADRLLGQLRELAASTDRLPLNRDLEALPGMQGQNVSYLLAKLRRRGGIEISFPARDRSIRLFKICGLCLA